MNNETCAFCGKIECPCWDRLMNPKMNEAMAHFRAVFMAHHGGRGEVRDDVFTYWGGPKWVSRNDVTEVKVGAKFYAHGVVMFYQREFDDGVVESDFGGVIPYAPLYTTMDMSELRKEAADYAAFRIR